MNNENVLNIDINKLRMKQLILRYITALFVFFTTAFFAPNFHFEDSWILALSAFVTVIVDYLVATVTGIHDSPLGRGIVGFVSATLIIYMTQFILRGYYITILSSLIAALIYGVIDYYIPNKD